MCAKCRTDGNVLLDFLREEEDVVLEVFSFLGKEEVAHYRRVLGKRGKDRGEESQRQR